jgi:molybdopterin-guanine dinucleotide biosynthesis protein
MDLTARPPLGVILAGGGSRRFGSPKALARVAGRRIIDRVADALGGATDEVAISGTLAVQGVRTLPDERPGLGPLGGVLSALRCAAREDRGGVLVAGCDMPFLSPAVLRLLRARGEASAAVAVVPASAGRRGFEPLCAWYSTRALDALEAMAETGELGLHTLAHRAPVEVLAASALRQLGDPDHLFFNVNTMDDLREAQRRAGVPPVVAVVGRKNSGKTTLVVALLAELGRRGWRVASMKHGHHAFESDQPGRDSWRHFEEGGAEATLMVGAGKVALTMRVEGEPDPEALIRAFYAGRGYDLVVVEGYKRGPFPRVEVFRRAVHDAPLSGDDDTGDWIAVVTDDAALVCSAPVLPIAPDDSHVRALAELLERRFLPPRPPHGG